MFSVPARQIDPGQFALIVHGIPLFVPAWQIAVLNAPFWIDPCPGQNSPVGDVTDAVPVVSGFRLIAMFPMNCAHVPPGQSPLTEQVASLLLPRKHFCVIESADGTGQSSDAPTEFRL